MKRYKRYSDIPAYLIKDLKEKVDKSPYRQIFHIEGDMGFINDPNGCSYFDGKYHLFHQWSPLNYSKESWFQGWYHLTSTDMVTWESVGPSIQADSIYETHGSYSGSALDEGEQMLMFYTGNTRVENNERIPYQIVATMDKEYSIKKELPQRYKEFQKDILPILEIRKCGKNKDDYYAIIGAQRENLTGAALILFSQDGTNWEVLGEVETPYKSLGYMWECPNYLEIGSEGLFIFCPQGLEAEDEKYKNIYQCGYIIGNKIDKNNLRFTNKQDFEEIDKGFDFYAAQVMQGNGRNILFAWMGLPEMNYPTEEYGYSGCLTMPRELFMENGKLIQKPLPELNEYKEEVCNDSFVLEDNKPQQYESHFGRVIEIQLKKKESGITLLDLVSDDSREYFTRILFDYDRKTIILDREKSGAPLSKEYGIYREIYELLEEDSKLEIFIDRSSIEIFINGGEVVASSRIFPGENQTHLFIEGKEKIKKLVYNNGNY